MHNAIDHNLPELGSVWVTTSLRSKHVVLTVENTGEQLAHSWLPRLTSHFAAAASASAPTTQAWGWGWQSPSIAQAHDGSLTLAPRPAGGLRVTVQLPAAPARPGDGLARSAERAAD